MKTTLINSLILIFFFAGCTSVPKALRDVKVGWNKADVVETAGNPSRSYRKNSVDHWVYNYYEEGVPKTRTLLFSQGKVVGIGSSDYNQSSSKLTEKDMEDYKASLKQKDSSQESFQDLE